MYFDIWKNKDGMYWWRAMGDNNEIMAYSELMYRKDSCESAIRTIKREAATASVRDRTAEAPAERRR